MKPIDRLVWVDIETTGLDASKDAILEVAVVVTDRKFNELVFQVFVVRPENGLPAMDQVVFEMHSKNGLLAALPYGMRHRNVDRACADTVKEYAAEGASLAGSSVHFDRKFIERPAEDGGMPRLAALLGYRCFDVSALKQAWCNEHGQEWSDPPAAHRALDDVRGSLAVARQLSVTRSAAKEGA